MDVQFPLNNTDNNEVIDVDALGQDSTSPSRAAGVVDDAFSDKGTAGECTVAHEQGVVCGSDSSTSMKEEELSENEYVPGTQSASESISSATESVSDVSQEKEDI